MPGVMNGSPHFRDVNHDAANHAKIEIVRSDAHRALMRSVNFMGNGAFVTCTKTASALEGGLSDDMVVRQAVLGKGLQQAVAGRARNAGRPLNVRRGYRPPGTGNSLQHGDESRQMHSSYCGRISHIIRRHAVRAKPVLAREEGTT